MADEKWTLKLRDDQVRLMQLVLQSALTEFTKYNRDWLPAKIAKMSIVELITELTDVVG